MLYLRTEVDKRGVAVVYCKILGNALRFTCIDIMRSRALIYKNLNMAEQTRLAVCEQSRKYAIASVGSLLCEPCFALPDLEE